MLEQWNNHGGTLEQQGGIVEHSMVEQWNRDGGTVQHLVEEQ